MSRKILEKLSLILQVAKRFLQRAFIERKWSAALSLLFGAERERVSFRQTGFLITKDANAS